MKRTGVVILGAGFIADIHAESLQRFVPEAEIVGVYARRETHARAFAAKHRIPRWFTDLEQAIAAPAAEVVDICLPNHLHARVAIDAVAAGRHVIVEKPLCLTLEEADLMIDAARRHNRKLMYAEELCFAPKYERVRQLVGEGAIGALYYMRHCEKHSGPHSDWFYDLDQSGGGALMDMGCHGFAWFRWMLGPAARPVSIYARMQNGLLHGARTRCEEHSISIVEFEGGVTGIVENSWAKLGGMEDRIEVCGTGGVVYADLFMGNSALTYSDTGYGYAMEKAGSTKGWTFTNVEEAFNQGYPHELKHFIECVRQDLQPSTGAEDGRAVLEMLYAAYHSARTGHKVALPFRAAVSKPIDLWLGIADAPAPVRL
jgi:predicted dehydrogenase